MMIGRGEVIRGTPDVLTGQALVADIITVGVDLQKREIGNVEIKSKGIVDSDEDVDLLICNNHDLSVSFGVGWMAPN